MIGDARSSKWLDSRRPLKCVTLCISNLNTNIHLQRLRYFLGFEHHFRVSAKKYTKVGKMEIDESA